MHLAQDSTLPPREKFLDDTNSVTGQFNARTSSEVAVPINCWITELQRLTMGAGGWEGRHACLRTSLSDTTGDTKYFKSPVTRTIVNDSELHHNWVDYLALRIL